MHTINVQQAHERIAQLLHILEKGEEIVIQRSEKPIAKLIPYSQETALFPDLNEFRRQITSTKNTLLQLRDNERY